MPRKYSHPTRICPACQETKPSHCFECLPYDKRCVTCMPLDPAAKIREQQIDGAEKAFAAILDEHDIVPADDTNLDKLIAASMRQFGGTNQFCELLVEAIKERYDRDAGDAKAIDAQMRFLKLVATRDKQRSEDEWRKMTDEQLHEAMKLQAINVLAEVATDDAKLGLVADLLRAHGLNVTPALAGEVVKDG